MNQEELKRLAERLFPQLIGKLVAYASRCDCGSCDAPVLRYAEVGVLVSIEPTSNGSLRFTFASDATFTPTVRTASDLDRIYLWVHPSEERLVIR